jgi:hypothetical protein
MKAILLGTLFSIAMHMKVALNGEPLRKARIGLGFSLKIARKIFNICARYCREISAYVPYFVLFW